MFALCNRRNLLHILRLNETKKYWYSTLIFLEFWDRHIYEHIRQFILLIRFYKIIAVQSMSM